MKLFSEFSGQIACEIGQRQNLCLITFVYCFVSVWPASEVVDSPFARRWQILVSTKDGIAPGFRSQ